MKNKSYWFSYSILGVTLLLGSYAQAASDLEMARSIVCNGFPSPIVVSLQGGDKTPGAFFSGRAAWHYETVTEMECKTSETQVTCKGIWSGGNEAHIKIKTQPDGTYKGLLLTPKKKWVPLGCLPSSNL